MNTVIKMLALIPRQRQRLYWTLALNTGLGLATLVPPYLLKVVIDDLGKVVRGGPTDDAIRTVVIALGVMAGVRVAVAITSYWQERLSDLLRLESILELRSKLFDHVLGLSVDYYESHRVGEIAERLIDSLYEFGMWLQELSEGMLLRIFTIVFSLGVMFWTVPAAGLAGLVTVGLKLWLALRKKSKSKVYRKLAKDNLGVLAGHVTETVQNLTTLRAFGGEAGSLDRHNELAEDARQNRLRQHRIEWRYNLVIELVEGVGVITAFGAVAWAAVRGDVSVGGILLVALYMQQVLTNLRPMASFIDKTGDMMTSADRVLELLAVEPTVRDAPGAVELARLERIEFRGVGFSYPGHARKVLSDISFTLEAGQMLALVGPSGTGKTTIVKLLLRLYDPTEGEILVNGHPVHHYTAESLRRHMGTVMQDLALFNDTLADNVGMADPNANASRLREALKLARVDEFAAQLPKGTATMVGERGVKLSGGQKQRVAIARAILKRPQLVLLDEATSALDSASERDVQAGLETLMRGRMAVVIAHRLSTVVRAQQILVLENGRVVERGTHAQLLEHGGLYAHLSELQSA